jgi:hypothetical protein
MNYVSYYIVLYIILLLCLKPKFLYFPCIFCKSVLILYLDLVFGGVTQKIHCLYFCHIPRGQQNIVAVTKD